MLATWEQLLEFYTRIIHVVCNRILSIPPISQDLLTTPESNLV